MVNVNAQVSTHMDPPYGKYSVSFDSFQERNGGCFGDLGGTCWCMGILFVDISSSMVAIIAICESLWCTAAIREVWQIHND